MSKIILTVGLPASGKSSSFKSNEPRIILSRDKEGGKIIDLLPKVEDSGAVLQDPWF
jgi:hypothetical protein